MTVDNPSIMQTAVTPVLENSPKKKRISEKLLQILSITLCVFSLIVASLSLIILIKGIVHPERPPSIFGITPVVMADESMQSGKDGAVFYGDILFLKKTDSAALKNDDVFAFYEDGIVRIGRVQGLIHTETDFRCYLKADNLPAAYPSAVTNANAVGKVCIQIRWLGAWALFLLTPVGKFFFIWIPLFIFVAGLLYEWWLVRKNSREDPEETEEIGETEETEETEEAQEAQEAKDTPTPKQENDIPERS